VRWGEVRDDAEKRLAALCLSLPEVHEQALPWGRHWRVRKNHFCQIWTLDSARIAKWTKVPPAAGDDEGGMMIFRSQPPELDALAHMGLPFFRPGWGARVICMLLDEATDWDEVEELVLDSYCIQAPQKLAKLVKRA